MIRKVCFVVLAVAVALLSTVAANAQGPVMEHKGEGSTHFNIPQGPIVLYDQTNNASGNGAPSQNFEAAFDAYDCEAADDFQVTFAGGWDVEMVNVVGTQMAGGVPSSVDVTFYDDNGGVPAAAPIAACTYPGLTSFTNPASLDVTLPTACSLAPGFYWVSVISNQDFLTQDQFFWSNRTVQSFSEGVWRNPGNGFGNGCINFTGQTTCGVGGGASPDFLFQLVGVEGATGIPTMNQVGLALLFALLLGGSLVFLRRRATV